MDEYFCRSTNMYGKYNKMDEETVLVMKIMEMLCGGDRDDAQACNDPSRSEGWCPSTSSPSRSLPEVSFLRALMSTNVRSRICLQR
jgi:hypothetical protein